MAFIKLSVWDVVLGLAFVAVPVGCNMKEKLDGCWGWHGDAQPTGAAEQALSPEGASLEDVAASCADGGLVARDCVAVLGSYAEMSDDQGCADEHAALVACAADASGDAPERVGAWRCDPEVHAWRACFGEDAAVEAEE